MEERGQEAERRWKSDTDFGALVSGLDAVIAANPDVTESVIELKVACADEHLEVSAHGRLWPQDDVTPLLPLVQASRARRAADVSGRGGWWTAWLRRRAGEWATPRCD